MQLSGGSMQENVFERILNPKRDCKFYLSLKIFSWSEFHIGKKKMRQYGIFLIKIVYKHLDDSLGVDYK